MFDGYDEICTHLPLCTCGGKPCVMLTHWDNDDEDEFGEWYSIYCKDCDIETKDFDDEESAEVAWIKLVSSDCFSFRDFYNTQGDR